MKNIAAIIAILSLLSACQEPSQEVQIAKDVWNWSANQLKEQEKYVIMTDMLKVGNYEVAQEQFQWIILENPDLHASLYESGLAIYQGLIAESNDPKIRKHLQEQKEKIVQLQAKYFP